MTNTIISKILYKHHYRKHMTHGSIHSHGISDVRETHESKHSYRIRAAERYTMREASSKQSYQTKNYSTTAYCQSITYNYVLVFERQSNVSVVRLADKTRQEESAADDLIATEHDVYFFLFLECCVFPQQKRSRHFLNLLLITHTHTPISVFLHGTSSISRPITRTHTHRSSHHNRSRTINTSHTPHTHTHTHNTHTRAHTHAHTHAHIHRSRTIVV